MVLITHFMDEVLNADRVVVLNQGKTVMQGTPTEVFGRRKELKAIGLDVPRAVELKALLQEDGFRLSDDILTVEELSNNLVDQLEKATPTPKTETFSTERTAEISAEHVDFVYNPKSPFEKQALKDVSFRVNQGDFMCFVGHTGSGKSTMVQHLNGLVRLQSGGLFVEDMDLKDPKIDLKKLRSTVGMVFQYPEYQLFADTVFNDVAFGPRNMKLSEEEVHARVKEALEFVGMDFDYVKEKSPFELSGGEKRRVAIAGVVAMRPKVLVLDEPTAGLDPRGKKEVLDLVLQLKQTCTPTIIMVNHDMNEVAEYADEVALFHDGTVDEVLPPMSFFTDGDKLKSLGLELPQMAQLKELLAASGVNVANDCLTVEKMRVELNRLKRKEANV